MTIILYGILCLAVISDVRTYRIPNALILSGLGIGMILRGFVDNFSGLIDSLLSGLLITILLFPLFLIKAFGAGDIKLFGVIAIFLSIKDTLHIFLISLFIGAVLGVLSSLFSFCFQSCPAPGSIYTNINKKNNLLKAFLLTIAGVLENYGFYKATEDIRSVAENYCVHIIHFSIPIAVAVFTYMEVIR